MTAVSALKPPWSVKAGQNRGRSVANRFLSAVKASPKQQQFFKGDSGAIHPEVAPTANDLIVTKNRVS